MLEIARGMLATGAPGAEFCHSNTNYELLGQMIEGLTGQTFIEAMQARVFDPVSMADAVPEICTNKQNKTLLTP